MGPKVSARDIIAIGQQGLTSQSVLVSRALASGADVIELGSWTMEGPLGMLREVEKSWASDGINFTRSPLLDLLSFIIFLVVVFWGPQISLQIIVRGVAP